MAASDSADAISLLKADHRKVEDLFDKFAAEWVSRELRLLLHHPASMVFSGA